MSLKHKSALKNCRTCLQIIDEIEYSILNRKIRRMLRTCTGIKMKVSKNFPDGICPKCYEDLLIAYKFKCRAESNVRSWEERFLHLGEGPEPKLTEVAMWETVDSTKSEEVYIVENSGILVKS